MSVTESKQFSNISATTLQFPLVGGKYGLDISATWSSGNRANDPKADGGHEQHPGKDIDGRPAKNSIVNWGTEGFIFGCAIGSIVWGAIIFCMLR